MGHAQNLRDDFLLKSVISSHNSCGKAQASLLCKLKEKLPENKCIIPYRKNRRESILHLLWGSAAYMQHIIFDLVIVSGHTYYPFMRVHSNIQTFVSAPTLFELFLFHFCTCDGEGHLLLKAARNPHTFFVMILYRVMGLCGIHFPNFLNSIHGSLH